MHHPTDDTKALVEAGAMAGVPQDSIAKALGIDAKTLRKHYRDELDFGKDLLVAKLTNVAAQKALNGDNTMLCFLLKTRGGFSETARLEHSGPDGKAIPLEGRSSTFDYEKLSPAAAGELIELSLLGEANSEKEAEAH